MAKTMQEVEGQDRRTRLRESLENAYAQRGEQINQSYDQAYSSAGNQLLSRGMGRSSFGAQTLANINQKRSDAISQNEADMIADYQNRLQDIEQQELAENQWERTFGLQQAQFDWQKENAQKQFDWDRQSAERQLAMNVIGQIASQGGTPSDALLAQAGLSRADFDAMKYQAPVSSGGGGGGRSSTGSSSTPAWKVAGFASEAEYKTALALGYKTKAAYDAYLNGNKSALDLVTNYDNNNNGNKLPHAEYKDSPFYIQPYDAKPLIEEAKKRRESLGLIG